MAERIRNAHHEIFYGTAIRSITNVITENGVEVSVSLISAKAPRTTATLDTYLSWPILLKEPRKNNPRCSQS